MTADETLLWTERLIAIALIQQSTELLLLRKNFSPEGIWSWKILRPEFPRPLGMVLDYPAFIGLIALQLVAALSLLAVSSTYLALFLFITAALIAMRFRGTFNGGSDCMTLIILAALVVARAKPEFAPGAMLYVAVQSGLSYFIAGLVKLKEPRWRSGTMLRDFMLLANYPVAAGARRFFASASGRALALLSWVVMIWECLFPLSFLSPRFALVFLLGGVVFHLTNVYVLGLNRFLFAWLASYPAILSAAFERLKQVDSNY